MPHFLEGHLLVQYTRLVLLNIKLEVCETFTFDRIYVLQLYS